MEMRASTSLGIIRPSRPAKHRPKRFLRKLVNYLKSDSYMFAPIISSSSKQKYRSSPREGFHLNRTGCEFGGEGSGQERKKKRLVEVIGGYLRSDSHLYAPLIEGDCFGAAHDHTSLGAPRLTKRVTTSVARTVLTRETIHQPAEDSRDMIAEGQIEQHFDANHESDNGSYQRSNQDRILKEVVFPNCWKSVLSEGDLPSTGSIAERVVHRRKIPVD